MPRVSTNQIAVLEAVVARLRDQIDEFNESTCFLSDAPEPQFTVPGNFFCTVSPTNGRFDEAAHAGGGQYTTFEYAGVAITVFRTANLDRNQHIATLITEQARGLLSLKHRILRALSGHDLQWEGNEILINLMAPLTADAPRSDGKKIGDLQLVFSTDFEWDLTS